ncbi:hypothetical protein [Kingella kingae]|uniref:hypothetical protein n=1 Tax=Kingella kingae TaxID=504 RepID=UPI001E5B7891|nr:hypothetical protein [Kingella kingae]
MQAISLIDPITPATESLCQCCLLTDGNAHRPDLLAQHNLDFAHNDKISEAMLPEIRTIAMLNLPPAATILAKPAQLNLPMKLIGLPLESLC